MSAVATSPLTIYSPFAFYVSKMMLYILVFNSNCVSELPCHVSLTLLPTAVDAAKSLYMAPSKF